MERNFISVAALIAALIAYVASLVVCFRKEKPFFGAIGIAGVVFFPLYSTADTASAFALATGGYIVLMGAVAALVLWRLTVSVAGEKETLFTFDTRDGRIVGAWVVVAASFLLPMAMLVLTLPDFASS